MAGEQYAERAVALVADYLEANYQTHLTAVETALGLTAGSLEPPEEYLAADLPLDNRNLIEVWSASGDADDDVNGIWSCDVSVARTFTGDADAEAGQLKARRYVSALIRAIRADRTLGGNAGVTTLIQRYSLAEARGDQSYIRHAAMLELSVRLHEA